MDERKRGEIKADIKITQFLSMKPQKPQEQIQKESQKTLEQQKTLLNIWEDKYTELFKKTPIYYAEINLSIEEMTKILKYCIKNRVSCEEHFSYLYDDETKMNKISKSLKKIFITVLILGSLIFILYCKIKNIKNKRKNKKIEIKGK